MFRTLTAFALLLSEPAYGQSSFATRSASPLSKVESAITSKWIKQLGSPDFRIRERASLRLGYLDAAPKSLREAAKSGDSEVAKRADDAIKLIRVRAVQRAYETTLRDIKRIQFDRFLRRLADDAEFAKDDLNWTQLGSIAAALTREAYRLGERSFLLSELDHTKLRKIIVHKDGLVHPQVSNSIVIAAQGLHRIKSITGSIVLIDGDWAGAERISNSLIVVRGNVLMHDEIRNSIVLSTGHLEDGFRCESSFVQSGNTRIGFAIVEKSVFTNSQLGAGVPTQSNVVLATVKGPLDLLAFGSAKSDDQLSWSKPADGLQIAIHLGHRPDQFFIRWKNIGEDPLAVPINRRNTNSGHSRDDLIKRVYLVNAHGSILPNAERVAFIGGLRGGQISDRTVIIGPGKTYEECVDLWRYVQKTDEPGRYTLSVDVEIPARKGAVRADFVRWSGSIRSNAIEIQIGK